VRIGVLALLCAAASASACTAYNCAASVPGGEPAIELGYVSESDAPTITLVRLYLGAARYPDRAVIELEPSDSEGHVGT